MSRAKDRRDPHPARLAGKTPRRRRRGGDCAPEAPQELRLLPGRTITMSASQRAELVDALAELLADHLEAKARRPPAGLRSAGRPGVVAAGRAGQHEQDDEPQPEERR